MEYWAIDMEFDENIGWGSWKEIGVANLGIGEKLLFAAKISNSLVDLNSTLLQEFKAALQNPTEFSSNSLAIVAKILSLSDKFELSSSPEAAWGRRIRDGFLGLG
ncbi:hypothetical protein ACFX12_025772 [Malus domestica]